MGGEEFGLESLQEGLNRNGLLLVEGEGCHWRCGWMAVWGVGRVPLAMRLSSAE